MRYLLHCERHTFPMWLPIWLLGSVASCAAKTCAQVRQDHSRTKQRAIASADAITEPGTDASAHTGAHSKSNAFAITSADIPPFSGANASAEPSSHTGTNCAAYATPNSGPYPATYHCTISTAHTCTDAASVRQWSARLR